MADPHATQLKKDIEKIKVDCFNFLRDLSRLSREHLDNAGYKGKTNAEAMQMAFDRSAIEVEQKIRKWEKENPDV